MDTLGVYNQISFPKQKIPTSQKSQDWFKENVDAAESMLYNRNLSDRERYQEMDLCRQVYDGQAIPEDYEKIFNPMGLEGVSFPSEVKNYPISSPKIDLIVGEEYLRRDEFMVRSVSESAISNKQDVQHQILMEAIQQEISSTSFDEEDAQKRFQKIGKFLKYSWKDLTELTASRLLHYVYKYQNLKKKFNEGMLNILREGRVVYRIDEVAGDISIEKCEPATVFPLGFSKNFNVEDSDVIVQVQYLPIGKVVDEFYEHLKKEDIAFLEGGTAGDKGKSVLNYSYINPRLYYPIQSEDGEDMLIDVDDTAANYGFVGPFDRNGNVRVVRVRWRGRKKIGKLSYIDEFGDMQERWVSEHYKPNRELGESVSWKWVNEANEGTKIGGKIYVKMQPRKVQIRHLNNKSKCDLGFVGIDCGKSMMSRMMPFQFAYNVYMRRLELLVARFGGPIVELDTSKIPDDWDLDKWMYYLHVLGYMVVDPWNEGKKGAAQGKLAGNFNTTGKAISPEVGSFIQQNIQMLSYIENQIGTISGVTKQREGQVDNRETVGGVERAVTQSSHITEKWFILHEDVKRRTLQACIDVAKQIYKGKNMKSEFILDDMSRVLMDIEGDSIAYEDLEVFVSSSSEDQKIRQSIEGLAQSFVQNGSSASTLINVLKSESIAEMTNLLEEDEEMRAQIEQEMAEIQKETRAMELERDSIERDKDRELKRYEIDMKYMEALMSKTEKDDSEELSLKIKQHEDKMKLERDKFEESVRSNKKKEEEATRHNRAMESKKTSTSSK